MKKILSFLAIGSILSTGSTNVIACSSKGSALPTRIDPGYNAALVDSVKNKIEHFAGPIEPRGYRLAIPGTNKVLVSSPLTSNAIKSFLSLTPQEAQILDISTQDSSDTLTMNQIKELSYHIQAGASSETVLHDTKYVCDSGNSLPDLKVVAKVKWEDEDSSIIASRSFVGGTTTADNQRSALWEINNLTGEKLQVGTKVFNNINNIVITSLAVFNNWLFVATDRFVVAFTDDFNFYAIVQLTNDYNSPSLEYTRSSIVSLINLDNKLVIVSDATSKKKFGGLYILEKGSDKSFRTNNTGIVSKITTRIVTYITDDTDNPDLRASTIKSVTASDDYLFISAGPKDSSTISPKIYGLDLSSDIFDITHSLWTLVSGISTANTAYSMITKNGILYAACKNTLPGVGNEKSTLAYKMNIAAYHADNFTTFTEISTNLSIAGGVPICASEVGYPTDLMVYDDSVYLSTTGSGLWRLKSDDSWKSVRSFVYANPEDATSAKNFNIGYLFSWKNDISLSAGQYNKFGDDIALADWSNLLNISFY